VLPVKLYIVIENVVLARNVVHVQTCLSDDAVRIVELCGLGEMRDIAGVNQKSGFYRQRADLVDRFLQSADRVRVSWLVEPDMAVADLQEGEPARARGLCFADDSKRVWYPARDGPQHARARPSHAFQDLAPADAVIVM
jgi:hypothetical protein